MFIPEREKILSGACFQMVGAHPSMPYTLGGYGNLAPAEMRERAGSAWAQGTITKSPGADAIKMGQGEEVVDLPLNKPEDFMRWTRPNFFASFLVEQFISAIQ